MRNARGRSDMGDYPHSRPMHQILDATMERELSISVWSPSSLQSLSRSHRTINLLGLQKRASAVRSAVWCIAVLRAWNWVGRSSPASVPKREFSKTPYATRGSVGAEVEMFITYRVLCISFHFSLFSARVFLVQFRVFNSNFFSKTFIEGIKWAHRRDKTFDQNIFSNDLVSRVTSIFKRKKGSRDALPLLPHSSSSSFSITVTKNKPRYRKTNS